jgi:hypothetical protein
MAVDSRRAAVAVTVALTCSLGGCSGSTSAPPSGRISLPPSPANVTPRPPGSSGVRLTLRAGAARDIAVGVARRIRVIVTNPNDTTIRGLQLGSSNVVAGSPGSAREQWSPAFPGPCGAAAGTSYCPLPPLPPHGTYLATLTVTVPRTIGGQSTIGTQFVQTAFTFERGQQVVRYRRVRLNVIGRAHGN